MKSHLPNRRRLGGFSLVEVTLALGLAAFCLLAVFGLLPTGMTNDRESHHRTAAAALATDVIGNLRLTASVSPSNALTATSISPDPYDIPFPAIGQQPSSKTLYVNEDGTLADLSTGGDGGPIYRVTVTITPPSGANVREATTAKIEVTWPYAVDPTAHTPAGSYQTVVGLDRN